MKVNLTRRRRLGRSTILLVVIVGLELFPLPAHAPSRLAVADVATAAVDASTGYEVVDSKGAVSSFGEAENYGSASSITNPITGMALDSETGGYWLAATDGRISSYNAPYYGSTGDLKLNEPIVGIASTPDGGGYWLVASDGGIFSFGDARFYGSTGDLKLNEPIVGIASTPDGGGYWLVASDGGIFSFGDARFYGSTGDLKLNEPIVGIASTPDGGGYWLVASDGGIFSFGDARFYGSTGDLKLNEPIVGIASTPDGGGYWLVASDGGIFSFGDARFYGSRPSSELDNNVVGIASDPTSEPISSTNGSHDTSSPAPELSVTIAPATVNAKPGIMSAYVGPGDPGALIDFSNETGLNQSYGSDFFDDRSWSEMTDNDWVIDQWASSGKKMVFGLPMLPATGGYTLAAGASGSYNAYYLTLAQNLVAKGMGNSILRLGWEFNSSTYTWYAAGQANNFVAYWRQIVSTMRSVPGSNFDFMWDPQQGDNGPKDAAMGDLSNYYPGNDFVDLIGMDIYDKTWNTYPGATAEFSDLETQTYGLSWLANFGSMTGKPLAIPEMGLGNGPSGANSGPVTTSGPVSGGDNPTFIEDMASWIASHNVREVGFWDYSYSSIEEGHNPLTMVALEKYFSSIANGSR